MSYYFVVLSDVGGRVYHFDARPADTVDQYKAKVAPLLGLRPSEITLVYGDKPIDDDDSLHAIGYQSGTPIKLVTPDDSLIDNESKIANLVAAGAEPPRAAAALDLALGDIRRARAILAAIPNIELPTRPASSPPPQPAAPPQSPQPTAAPPPPPPPPPPAAPPDQLPDLSSLSLRELRNLLSPEENEALRPMIEGGLDAEIVLQMFFAVGRSVDALRAEFGL